MFDVPTREVHDPASNGGLRTRRRLRIPPTVPPACPLPASTCAIPPGPRLAAVTIYLPPAECRYRYVLRWSLPNQPQGAPSLMPGSTALSTATVNAGTRPIPVGAAKITGASLSAGD